MKSVALLSAVMALILMATPTTTTATSSARSTWYGMDVIWRLPLGVSPTDGSIGEPSTPNIPIVTDPSSGTTYTADASGTIFAVDSTGVLLWSQATSSKLQELFFFEEHPSVVYALMNENFFDIAWVERMGTVVALSTTDGAVLGRVSNLTSGTGSSWGQFIRATSYGVVAATSTQGLLALSPDLRSIQWQHRFAEQGRNGTALQSIDHFATGKDIVVVFLDRTPTSFLATMLTFHAKNGSQHCNISSVAKDYALMFMSLVVGWDNSWIMATKMVTISKDYAKGMIFQVNPATCEVDYHLGGLIDNAALFHGGGFKSALHVGNSIYVANLTDHQNFTAAVFRVQAYMLGSRNVSWTTNLKFHFMASTVQVASPFLTVASGQPDVLVLWMEGVMHALNRTTGALLWTLQDQIPAGPTGLGNRAELVYPLGTSQILIPNLLGFVTANTTSGAIEGVTFASPQATTMRSIRAKDGSPLVVIPDGASGDLVAVRGNSGV